MSPISRRRTGLAATLALMLATPALAAPQGQIVVAQGLDVITLDATMDISAGGLNVLRNIFSQLTLIGEDGSVRPDLASKWEASDGAKTWVFTLVPTAKFEDGTPVTVEDVIWSFQKVKDDARSPVRQYMQPVAKMEAVGTNQVKFTLNEPFAAFDRHVSLLSVVSKAAYQRMGAEEYSKKPIASGPFRVVRWVKDDRVELEAIPNYWGGEPKVKTVIFRPVPSEAARFAALQAGDIDVVAGLPPAVIDRMRARGNIKVETVTSNRVVYLGVNVTNPLLADVKLRQAMDFAIDRKAISESLLRGTGKPTGQMLAEMTFGYDKSVQPTARNVERAKQLVKESGYKGEKILLQYPTNRITLGNEIAQALAGYFTEIGINVELEGSDYATFSKTWVERKHPALFMFSYGPSIMDAELLLSTLYESRSTKGYWTDPKVDQLILAQRGETDRAKREKMIQEILKLEQAAKSFLPIYNEIHAYGVNTKVKWSPRPDERLLFKDAEVSAR